MSREKKAKLGTLDSDTENQPKTSGRKEIPRKCLVCATLKMPQVHELHGGDGGCWDPAVCRSRRLHAKKRDIRNAARNLKNRKGDQKETDVSTPDLLYAVLIEYRLGAFGNSRLHALGTEVWNAEGKFDFIKPRHCIGLTPTQIYEEVDKFLVELDKAHGLKDFALKVRLDVMDCPIRPCPHHSAGRE
jgi:hypothetical protein